MINRAELKKLARERLGGNIFSQNWMMALLVLAVQGIIAGVAGYVIPGLGAVIITGPLSVGVAFVFLNLLRNGSINFTEMFKGFTNDFGGNFLIGLLISVFTFLWSLLFAIPGIVKAYSYSMAFFLKNDNPSMDWRACINASKELTYGYKWQLFVLDLSFIGWYILGGLCFGIGALWVAPYHFAAQTAFYQIILDKHNGRA